MRTYGPIVVKQLGGNALLMGLAYYWLGVGESSALSLVWSLVVAAAIVLLACWLHGATFVYFASETPSLKGAFRTALRYLAPLLVAAVAITALYWLLALWADYSGKPAFQIASWLTMKLRKPVRPASVLRVFNAVLWLVRWMAVPVLVLPVIAGICARGWRGFRAVIRRGWYWVEVPVLLVCAFWVPAKLWGWVPHVNGFGWEMVSFVVRMVAGYLCFVAAWLGVIWVTARESAKTSL